MRICLFEDPQVAFLEPLALTRPAFELRCGARTLAERQQVYFAAGETGALVRPYLANLCRFLSPRMAVNDTTWLNDGPTLLVNGRWLPPEGPFADPATPRVALVGEQVAYVVPPPERLTDCTTQSLPDYLRRWQQTLPHVPAGGWMIDFPWNLVERNGDMLRWDFAWLGGAGSRPDQVAVVGPGDRLFIGGGVHLDPLIVADTRNGPVVVDQDAVIHAFTRLEGPCYVGKGSWILGAKVRGDTTIGPMCRVGGEIEASILHGYSNKYHDGFLGHSYVGEWVNLAAGTQVSDLRNDYGPVPVTVHGTRLDTRQSKVGSFLGDHTKTGLNVLLNTGTVAGAFCNLLPTGALLPKVVPSFCRVYHGQVQERPDWREAIATAATVMRRRGQELTGTHEALYQALFEQTAAQRQQALREAEQRRSTVRELSVSSTPRHPPP